jgi:hypothetical protein
LIPDLTCLSISPGFALAAFGPAVAALLLLNRGRKGLFEPTATVKPPVLPEEWLLTKE